MSDEKACRVQVAARWAAVFAACPQLQHVKFDFDVDGHQGKVYVGVSSVEHDGQTVHFDLSDLTETYQVSVEDQRLRFAAHLTVWQELRAFEPLRYRPLLPAHRKLTRALITRDGVDVCTGLQTNWWPPDENDLRFLPWSADCYPIGVALLAARGIALPDDLRPWPLESSR